MANQIQISIEPGTEHIVISFGTHAHVTMAPRDVLGFIAGLSTVLSQHSQFQPRPAPKIVVADVLPKIIAGIDYYE